ncbi:MAG: hypothetical protein DRG40_07715 [Deltaproteobacteria bacterium]|nr:MAG: hypothetical protein DRG40_07715 [Deltaproteobacteria bacterium]
MVIGLLMSREGVPVAHEAFPGNTADPEIFRSVLGALRERFRIPRRQRGRPSWSRTDSGRRPDTMGSTS